MEVNSFPIRIIPGIERSAVRVKLVAEDELPLCTVQVGCFRVYFLGSFEIDQAPVPRHAWYLTGTIYSTNIEPTEIRKVVLRKKGYQWVSSTRGGEFLSKRLWHVSCVRTTK
jgi:hypothetical protein